MKRVLLPQPVEAEARQILEDAGCEIVSSPDPKPETVLPLMRGVHGLILRTGIKITRELLSHAHDLCIISRTGAGLDNVDVAAATEKDIIVTANVGVNTISVVEHALSLILALSKQLFLMDREVRNGNFGIRYRNLPRELGGKILGLMGFGRIGSELGHLCHQMFRMHILACDPYLPEETKARYRDWVEFVDRDDLFLKSDVVSIHVPLTDNTEHAVGEREISLMKPEAFLINTSRGPVIDERALAKALQRRAILGAGLDVFSQEPIPKDHPLLALDNVIMTPHTAALTKECVIRMATEAAQCVVDLFRGFEPKNVANPQVLTSGRWNHLLPSQRD
jgi:D-3-phosphoglycerate dehydrogenase